MTKRKARAVEQSEGVFDVPKTRVLYRAREAVNAAKARETTTEDLAAQLAAFTAAGDLSGRRERLEEIQKSVSKLRIRLADEHIEELRDEASEYFRLPTVGQLIGGTEQERVRPSIILCDPPWTYSNPSHKVGTKGQYPTMSDEAIARMPMAGLAGEDCALLMWTTMPKLASALRIMELWGFEYKTVFLVWIKIAQYMARFLTIYGAYTRPSAEIVLIGTRGNMRSTLHNKGFSQSNVILSRPSDHSRKPKLLRNIAVELFGDLPRIELFCRESGSDWLAWGNEAAAPPSGAVDAAAVQRVETEPEGARFAATEKKERRNNLRGGAVRNSQGRQIKARAGQGSARGGKRPQSTLPHLEAWGEHNCLSKNDAIMFYEPPVEATVDQNDEEEGGVVAPVGLQQNAMIDEFCDTERTLAARRHPVYTSMNEAEVRKQVRAIRAEQLANADRLFAFNNNPAPTAKKGVQLKSVRLSLKF